MNHHEPPGSDWSYILADQPSPDLEYFLDDDQTPTTLTVCSAENAGSLATEWISIDVQHVMALDQMR